MTKYDVFYLLVMTSNVSSFVCFGTEGDYFSPYCAHGIAQVVVCHVFLCVVRIVAPQLSCVTRFRWRKSCYTPQDCQTAPLGSLQIPQCVKRVPIDEECGLFSKFRCWPTTSIISVVFVSSDSEAIVVAT